MNRTPIVPKTSADLAAAIIPLLRMSRDIRFVDSYFSANPEKYGCFLESLNSTLAVNGQPNDSTFAIQIHTSNRATIEFIRTKTEALFRKLLSPRQIKVYCWNGLENGERIHDRFVLTDLGGIESSYGWDNGDPGQTTGLTLLEHESYLYRWNQYSPTSTAFELAFAPIVITAGRRS
ncbi:MAG: hypothetical protein JNL58_31905 [Planctomyces sp.]|nr:hypothetical protein [Planctomyces sp.]